MKRRLVMGIASVLLLGLLTTFVIPSTRQAAFTLIHGEPYYKDRSASHWSEVTNNTRDPAGMAEAKKTLTDGGADAISVLLWMIASRRARGDLADWVLEIGEPAIPAV